MDKYVRIFYVSLVLLTLFYKLFMYYYASIAYAITLYVIIMKNILTTSIIKKKHTYYIIKYVKRKYRTLNITFNLNLF